MRTLLTRLMQSTRKVSSLQVTVYTRQQCCCCHKALDLLKGYQRHHGFAIEEVDVDGDPELIEQYGTSVPVVAVAGKVRFRGVVNPALFERLLQAESRGE
jgi:glutaredoxin